LTSVFAGITPVQSLDATDDGAGGVVVATGRRDGSTTLAWVEQGAARIVERPLNADHIVLERQLGPGRPPWSALACTATRIERLELR
jgi:hypothetical protein